MRGFAVACAVLLGLGLGLGQVQAGEPKDLAELVERAKALIDVPRAKLLILGTFHFSDPGLDDYKPEHDVPILSDERQAEVEAIVKALERFEPTHVAIEWPKGRQDDADRLYRKYQAAEHELRADEVEQLGFRLASRSGHTRVHCVDTQGRRYEPAPDRQAAARSFGQAELLDSPWWPLYEEISRWQDRLKTTATLQEYLLLLNSDWWIRASHGPYLVGAFKVAKGESYPGADHLSGWWYNRNIRIFANVLRLMGSSDDRIVVIIGAGHLPILRQLAQSSPEVELVELRDLLARAK